MLIFDKAAKTKNVAAIRQAIEPHPKVVRGAEFLALHLTNRNNSVDEQISL